MEYKAVGKLKPSNHEFILGVAWKNTKTSLFCWIKGVYHFLLFHHFLENQLHRHTNLDHFNKSIWEAKISCVALYINLINNVPLA